MGFFEHLEELRWTLVKSAIAFVACACLVGVFLKEFNHVLLQPLTRIAAEYPEVKVELGTTSIMEGFSVVIQMCTVGGLLLASPFIVFFFGQFVSPALTRKELRMVAPVGISAVVLFMLGCSFSFWLLVPSTIRVSIELNQLFGFALRWTPAAYYSLLTWLVAGVGASFEFPLIIVLAVYMGLLEVATLRKYRRHAVVAIFILAAVVTPTPILSPRRCLRCRCTRSMNSPSWLARALPNDAMLRSSHEEFEGDEWACFAVTSMFAVRTRVGLMQ